MGPGLVRVRAEVDRLYREEHGRIIAPLIRLLGGFERAEEVVQDAFEAALSQWPSQGIPDTPRAWVLRTARNKAVDRIRRSSTFEDKRKELEAVAEVERSFAPAPDEGLEGPSDDMLRLVFTCCHPALRTDAQVALTLRTICGLTTDEIARAFLVDPRTMAQRLVRAKKKIELAGIPYRVPDPEELPERTDAALATLYLVFNEGYSASAGDALVRRELCREGIRLAELVRRLLPDASEPKGLLALMMLHDSRRSARTNADGDLVTLEEQDRSTWDRAQIEAALPLVEEALRGRPRKYSLQAAVAALHARAPDPRSTDWRQIAALYAVHLRIAPSPVVELNAAVAVAMAGDMDEGLRRIDALEARGTLARYHLLHAARADLLRRLERTAEAAAAYRAALALVGNEVERRYLERRLAELG